MNQIKNEFKTFTDLTVALESCKEVLNTTITDLEMGLRSLGITKSADQNIIKSTEENLGYFETMSSQIQVIMELNNKLSSLVIDLHNKL